MQVRWFCLVLVAFTSCARPKECSDKEVATTIRERLDKQVVWQKSEAIESILPDVLDRDTSVQVALTHNKRIQAAFQLVGIAWADLYQAGLFSNPLFSGAVRFADRASASTNIQASVTQGLLDLFMIPLRQRLAEEELTRAELIVTQEVLQLAFEVEEAFYGLLYSEKMVALTKELVEVYAIDREIAQRQYSAGTINELALQERTLAALQAELGLMEQQKKLAQDEAAFFVLLAIDKRPLSNTLPLLPKSECDLARSMQKAQEMRLDLALLRNKRTQYRAMIKTKKWWAYTDPALGLSYEKEDDGTTVFGPEVAFSLPLFDDGSASRYRILAEIGRVQHELEVLERAVDADVRSLYQQITRTKRELEYVMHQLLPLQKGIVEASYEFYNIMGLGIYQLLQAKKSEIECQIALLEKEKQYWQLKVALKRAVGGAI